jgi:adenylate kinase
MTFFDPIFNTWNRLVFGLVRLLIWTRHTPIFVVLLGGPGAGKGTLAKMLAPFLGIGHLSTGDVFRRERKRKSRLGKRIQSCIDNAELVPDALTLEVLKQELRRWRYRHGAILDGIPRTLLQALLIDELFAGWGVYVLAAASLEPEDETLVWRLSYRLTCTNKTCGRTYHQLDERMKPKTPGICDACKSPLFRRDDDSPELIPKRMETHRREIAPICAHYGPRLIVVKPTKETTEQEVFSEVTAALPGKRR